ncbi:OmpH family outer membrane protein [Neolewinella antarctica]|uniref:Outer membrane protein n=1 Tax=Neolewinella antarctica TaxID=442734 RepID=A0ABX0XDF8_9BACT|nr:OmpH family outer membrane protein [Neolewinella antarctica]NJC27286.1 outer membrane protein [Neolewinella antarctica]
MKKFFQLALVAVMILAATATATAQKYGYVNADEIIAAHPEMKVAESNLESLQKQLQKKGEAMVQKFQTDYQALEAKAQAGDLTPKQQQEEATKLEVRQKEIAEFERTMIADLQAKRVELLEPIYTSVNEAIEAIAKENDYQFVFSQQTLLYGDESADLTSQVKTKLGL